MAVPRRSLTAGLRCWRQHCGASEVPLQGWRWRCGSRAAPSLSYAAETCYNRTDCRIGEIQQEDTAVVLRRHGGDGGATAVIVRCRGGAAATPLQIGPTRGGTAEVLNMFKVSAVPPRRSAVLTVFPQCYGNHRRTHCGTTAIMAAPLRFMPYKHRASGVTGVLLTRYGKRLSEMKQLTTGGTPVYLHCTTLYC